MQNIESTIVELGSIFQQLAHMVKEQEETIQRWARLLSSLRSHWHEGRRDLILLFSSDRIDANVEDTQLNVEAAHTEILKYFQSVSSNRWLMIKIFLVLVVFFIIFVVFFAWRRGAAVVEENVNWKLDLDRFSAQHILKSRCSNGCMGSFQSDKRLVDYSKASDWFYLKKRLNSAQMNHGNDLKYSLCRRREQKTALCCTLTNSS